MSSPIEEEREAMAAAFERPTLVAGHCKGESCGGDLVRTVQHGDEVEGFVLCHEEAEERRSLMVGTEEPEEATVRDEAAPTLANKGGAEKGGWLRRKAEEDLPEDVILVVHRAYTRCVIINSQRLTQDATGRVRRCVLHVYKQPGHHDTMDRDLLGLTRAQHSNELIN
jgi:hypothetical protein